MDRNITAGSVIATVAAVLSAGGVIATLKTGQVHMQEELHSLKQADRVANEVLASHSTQLAVNALEIKQLDLESDEHDSDLKELKTHLDQKLDALEALIREQIYSTD